MLDRSTRLFLRFRDRGDTAALAAVFDRTAPELLRLALHLCRHLGDAEDMLQATFLAAIESAPRFDRTKKVYVGAYHATRPHVTDATTGRAIEAFGLIVSDGSGYPKR